MTKTPPFSSDRFRTTLRAATTAAEISAAVHQWAGPTADMWPLVFACAPAVETGLLYAAVYGDAATEDILAGPLTEEQRRDLASWSLLQVQHRTDRVRRAEELIAGLQRTSASSGVEGGPRAADAAVAVLGDSAERDHLFALSVPKGKRARANASHAAYAKALLLLPNVTEEQLLRLAEAHGGHRSAVAILTAVANHGSASPVVWQRIYDTTDPGAWPNPTSYGADASNDYLTRGALLWAPRARRHLPLRAALWRAYANVDSARIVAEHCVLDDLPDGPVAAWLLQRRAPNRFRALVLRFPAEVGRHLTPAALEALLADPDAKTRQCAAIAAGTLRPEVTWPALDTFAAEVATAEPHREWILRTMTTEWGMFLNRHHELDRSHGYARTTIPGVNQVGSCFVTAEERAQVGVQMHARLAASGSLAEQVAVVSAAAAHRAKPTAAALFRQYADRWAHITRAAAEAEIVRTVALPLLGHPTRESGATSRDTTLRR